jgi:septal ring factor EnvC (AmiA/AmiB activator)
MKKIFPVFLLLLTACAQSNMDSYGIAASQKRQKQKLTVLQKKYGMAEKLRTKLDEEVEDLKEEMSQAELAMIRSAVEEYEGKLARRESEANQVAGLFLGERESLHKIRIRAHKFSSASCVRSDFTHDHKSIGV